MEYQYLPQYLLWTLSQHQCTYRVHLKINQLSSSQCYHYLSLVHSTFHNCFLPWCLPFVHPLICSDVPDAIWVHLKGKRSHSLLHSPSLPNFHLDSDTKAKSEHHSWQRWLISNATEWTRTKPLASWKHFVFELQWRTTECILRELRAFSWSSLTNRIEKGKIKCRLLPIHTFWHDRHYCREHNRAASSHWQTSADMPEAASHYLY